jgi:hypothetical protein
MALDFLVFNIGTDGVVALVGATGPALDICAASA